MSKCKAAHVPACNDCNVTCLFKTRHVWELLQGSLRPHAVATNRAHTQHWLRIPGEMQQGPEAGRQEAALGHEQILAWQLRAGAQKEVARHSGPRGALERLVAAEALTSAGRN